MGFGYIIGSDGKEIFMHASDIESRHQILFEDDMVEFQLGKGKNGKTTAVNVRFA